MTLRWLGVPLLLPLLASGACIAIPEFDDQEIIDRPRVLAIVAEPPEVAPGEPVTLSLMMAAPPGQSVLDYTVRWSVCGLFLTEIMGSQYETGPEERGCGPDARSFGDGTEVTLPGDASAALFTGIDLASMVLGSLLPEGTVEAIRDEVGLPLLVEATVDADGKVLRAVKRIVVNRRTPLHTNPPPPEFRFGEVEIVSDEGEPFRCRAADGSAVRAEASTEVELAPVLIPGDEDPELEYWLERYPVLNARGEVEERREKAFYSWFSTGGRFEQGITESPLRNEVWHTPGEAGSVPLWLVVRDGHGGTSACELDIEITP